MTAVYLYCILRSAKPPSLARVPAGLPGGGRPELLRLGESLWMTVAEVPLSTYGSGHLERHLEDLDWVGRIALAHEQVVEHCARRDDVTVAPMKLFTMFSSRERAVEEVGARRAAILALMRRISGAQEWGIRVTQRADALDMPAVAPPQALSGAAFLARKKEARDSAKEAKAAAADSALQAYRRLSKLARESRVRHDAPASAATPPLLDAAFLVPTATRGRFTQAARREAAACARAGAHMTLTGPWPAYNFVQESEGR